MPNLLRHLNFLLPHLEQYALKCILTLGALLSVWGFATVACAQSPDTLVVLYTGGAFGYLEACPCSKENLGGLARRATVIQQARAAFGDKVVLVDAGNQFSAYPKSAQEAQLLAQLLGDMHYDALNLAEYDFTYGLTFAQQTLSALPTVSVNVCSAAGEALAPKYRLKTVGSLRVAFLGLLTESALSSANEIAQRSIRLLPADAALAHALDSLAHERPDVIILLLRTQDIGYEKMLAEKFPQLSIIISNSPDLMTNSPTAFGQCLALTAGNDGEYIGQLMLIFNGRERIAAQNTLVALSPKVASDKKIAERIQAFKQAQKRKSSP